MGQVVEKTNGTITRVNPADIEKDFASVLQDEIVGTKVVLKMRLHKAMKFRNEDPLFLKEEGSLFEKEIGNATIKTKLTFEYENKPDEVLM